MVAMCGLYGIAFGAVTLTYGLKLLLRIMQTDQNLSDKRLFQFSLQY